MDAQEVVTAISSSHHAWLESQRSSPITEPRGHVWASGRRRCVRSMALDLMYPQEGWEDVDVERLARMHGGQHRERAIITDMMQFGPRCSPPFEVVEGQARVEIRDRDGTLLISGKKDGAIRFQGERQSVPFEVKSGVSFSRVESLDDLERSPWTRHAPDQLLTYQLANAVPLGLLIIDRPGVPLWLPLVLEENLERAEGFMVDARTAIDTRFGRRPLPPFIDDQNECKRCPHMGKSCAPPLDFGPGVRFLDDPDVEAALKIRETSRDAHLDYERADRVLKRLRGMVNVICGDFHILGKWQRRKVTEVPKEIADKYTTTKEDGAWIMDVERVPVTD